MQWELAETYGVSQSTISRAISAVTPLLARALARFVPVAEDLVPGRQYIVDGTLLPCWSWAAHPGLYSGKHKTTGMNVQVVCTLDGELVWISDPIEGARHDVFCLDESGVLDTLNPRDWTGDKGYVGRGMITPIKKTKGTRTARLGEGVQHRHQQNPRRRRTRHRQLQELANPPHRLPAPTRHLRHDDLRRHRTDVLLAGLKWRE